MKIKQIQKKTARETEKQPEKQEIIIQIDNIDWLISEDNPNFHDLQAKWTAGFRSFKPWEIFPEARISAANDILSEVEILEQAWWDTQDESLRRILDLRMLEYQLIIESLLIDRPEIVADLTTRVETVINDTEKSLDVRGRSWHLYGMLYESLDQILFNPRSVV